MGENEISDKLTNLLEYTGRHIALLLSRVYHPVWEGWLLL